MMFDAIVVGARCAGSPLSMLLARDGFKVLAVDRDHFPSDTLSTAFLRPDAVRRLQDWGLYEAFLATNPPSGPGVSMFFNGMALPSDPNGPVGFAPRRTYFDKLLVDAARESGADVREGFSVRELLRDSDGRVTGIEGRDAEGNTVREEAPIVVGADGRNSFVARQVHAEEYDVHEGHSAGYYAFFTGFPMDAWEFHLAKRHALFSFPTHDNAVCLAMEAPVDNWDEIRPDPRAYMQRIADDIAPTYGDRLRSATLTEGWFGMKGRPAFFRKPYGPGWALAGDAGFLKDPILGTGIDDAFRDADLLSNAIARGLRGDEPMESALAAYQQVRDAQSKPLFDVLCEFASMQELGMDVLMRLGALQAAATQSSAAQ